SPLLRRLRRAGRQPPRQRVAAWPHSEGRAFVARAGRGAARCEVQVSPEAAARLADRGEVPDAPLAALLGSGAVALRCTGAPALQWEAPVYLVLRNLVRDAAALLQAWEAGEPAFRLHFGSAEVSCDLARDEVRAPGWRAPPPPLSRGRIRRLVYREAWKARADERPNAIWPCAGAIVTTGAHKVVGRDAASGKLVFEETCQFTVRAAGSDDVFVSGSSFLA